jgi:Cu/Ag efflux pump CusA
MGGMISATVLAIFLVPVFFVVMRRRFPPASTPLNPPAQEQA